MTVRFQIPLRWVAATLPLLALVTYLVAVGTLAVDFPYWDDYYAVLDSLGNIRAAETLGDKAAAVISQHNEHRVAWLRVLSLACWTLEGRVDFRTLIWLGNAGLVALAVLLIAGVRHSIRWPCLLALIPLALVSPIQGKQMIWAMAAISNYWVLVFAAAALLLLSKGTRATFAWACFLAVMATFTSGQGLLCFAAGLPLLALQRRWARASSWLAIMGLCALVYFHGYSRPPSHPPPELSWTAFQFFPVAVGGAFGDVAWGCLAPIVKNADLESALIPTIRASGGLVLIGLIAWLWVRRYDKRNPFVSIFLLYLLMVFATASLSRSGPGFGVEQAYVSHYRVISVSIAVLVIVGLLDQHYARLGRPFPQAPILLGGALFCVLSWFICFPEVTAFSAKVTTGQNWFVQDHDGRGVLSRRPRQQGLDILWHSYLTGLLPLSDLSNKEIRLPPDWLTRIATPGAESFSPPPTTEGRFIAQLQWAGDDLLLVPNPSITKFSTATGSLLFQRGKLQYVLPARSPIVSAGP